MVQLCSFLPVASFVCERGKDFLLLHNEWSLFPVLCSGSQDLCQKFVGHHCDVLFISVVRSFAMSISSNVYVVPVVSNMMTWHCIVYYA